MMLTGNKLLAKNYRGRLLVSYLDPSDSRWGTVVEWILSKGKELLGQSRSLFEEEINEYPGSLPDALVFSGLVKVFSDNCSFEQSTEFDAVKIRELVFSLASNFKQEGKLSSDIEVRKNIF